MFLFSKLLINWVGLCRWMNSRQHLNSQQHHLVALLNLKILALWLFPHGPLRVCFITKLYRYSICEHICVFIYVCVYKVAHSVQEDKEIGWTLVSFWLMLPNVALLNYCLISCALVLIRQVQTIHFHGWTSIRRKHGLLYLLIYGS